MFPHIRDEPVKRTWKRWLVDIGVLVIFVVIMYLVVSMVYQAIPDPNSVEWESYGGPPTWISVLMIVIPTAVLAGSIIYVLMLKRSDRR